MNNANDPAFPNENPDAVPVYSGLTKREYFAAMAMQGILSDASNGIAPNWGRLAQDSLCAADALIKALGDGNE